MNQVCLKQMIHGVHPLSCSITSGAIQQGVPTKVLPAKKIYNNNNNKITRQSEKVTEKLHRQYEFVKKSARLTLSDRSTSNTEPATPKSANLTRPSFEMRMLPAFRSLRQPTEKSNFEQRSIANRTHKLITTRTGEFSRRRENTANPRARLSKWWPTSPRPSNRV